MHQNGGSQSELQGQQTVGLYLVVFAMRTRQEHQYPTEQLG